MLDKAQEKNCGEDQIMEVDQLKSDRSQGAKEALDLLDREYISLVISEVNLTDSDGFELLRVLRKKHPEIVTLLASIANVPFTYRLSATTAPPGVKVPVVEINNV